MSNKTAFSKDNSILETILSMLGVNADCDTFDTTITVMINSALMKLYQLGVGSKPIFQITGRAETWTEFLGDSFDYYSDVVTFIYISVRIAFDPPASATILNSLQNVLSESEFRLNMQYECRND